MQEWNEYKNEYTDTASEYMDSGEEYSDPAPEYFEVGTVPKDEGTEKGKSKVRKMAYLVAATVSVTTIGQTLTPQSAEVPQSTPELSQKEQSDYYQFEWYKVPGLDGTYGQGTNANVTTETENNTSKVYREGMLYLDAYEGFGYSNGGVVPVIMDGRWTIVDLEGNLLTKEKFYSFWMSPNADGYTIFRDENEDFVVVGKDGSMVTYDSEVRNLCIGEDNIISYKEYNNEDGKVHFAYHYADGSVLFETPWREGYELCMANAFRDGKAYATYGFDADEIYWLALNEISLDGTVTERMNKKALNDAYIESGRNDGTAVDIAVYGAYDGYSDGVFVGTSPGAGGGVCLVSPQSGSATNWIILVTIPELEINGEHVFDLLYYRSNGMDMMHSGSLGCMEIETDSGKDKEILFDFNACSEDQVLYEYIACYDTIIFDDYKYLAVQDGEQYFYIDLAGNVVSDTYIKATAFNDKGYALVLEENEVAYIIDDKFRVVETYHGVGHISLNDQLFVIRCFGENPDNYEQGTYGFYYEK